MENTDKLVITPYRDIFITWVLFVDLCFVFMICFIIGLSLYDGEKIPWIGLIIGFLCFSALTALVAIVFRLCYKGKLYITSDEVIKVHRKKVQFKIKKSDIVSIGVRKLHPLVKLFSLLLQCFLGDMGTDLIFFRYYQAEIFNERRFFDFYRVNSISEEETDLKEFAECVTYKQAKKICDFLGMPFEKV